MRTIWRHVLLPLCVIALGGAAPAAAQSSRSEAPPQRADIEGALDWNYGQLCRDLIDACLDEQGNALFEPPEFAVSQLRCRRLARNRFNCAFDSTTHRGAEILERSRCTATLFHSGTWYFERDVRRRRTALHCAQRGG